MESELRQNAVNAAAEAIKMWQVLLRALENGSDWYELMDTARGQRDEAAADFEEALSELRGLDNSGRKSAANKDIAA